MSVSREKIPCEQGLPHYMCYKQSKPPRSFHWMIFLDVAHQTPGCLTTFLFLMRRRRRTVSPWNADPLRSTTLLRIIPSARRSRGNSSALNRSHATHSVTLEERGICCRTDGPRRVLSCQMWHTIAAINAAWCRLCVERSPRTSDSASCGKLITTCSKR